MNCRARDVRGRKGAYKPRRHKATAHKAETMPARGAREGRQEGGGTGEKGGNKKREDKAHKDAKARRRPRGLRPGKAHCAPPPPFLANVPDVLHRLRRGAKLNWDLRWPNCAL